MTDRVISMSPDGEEIYFSIASRGFATIQFCENIEGIWSEPEVASFVINPDFFYFELHVTPDGEHLLFLSIMPSPGEEPLPGWGISISGQLTEKKAENGERHI